MSDEKEIESEDDIHDNQENKKKRKGTGRYFRTHVRHLFSLKSNLTDTFPDIAGSPEQLKLLVIPVFPNVCFPPGHFLHEL